MDPTRWQQMEDLYNAVLACEPGERNRLLNQADPEIRREVEQLLAQNGSLLDGPAWKALPEETVTVLAAGHRLGRYQIETRLGAGGMGEVFRARDTQLNRIVALKISKIQFSERFEREAQAIAALNHPNICQLHDVGVSPSGSGYLVMELIEGESPKGPLPLAAVVKYASQIAGALEAAHEKGIVHRDLKPANIKITPAGIVKVLDFGLAKVVPPSGAASDDSPAVAASMTETGTILGTAAYMSPEQARGEPVDKRTDIWAFGVILYELLTGERLYQGRTVSDVLALVLTKEPDLTKVPAQARKLLRRCLERDPQNRLRDIGDAMALLEEEAPPAPVPARVPRAPWLAASALLLVAAAAGFGWWKAAQPVERSLVRFDVDLGPDIAMPLAYGTSTVILSPDGSRLVYLASRAGGPARLFTRKLDQAAATELPGTEGANSPFFSPDGQWIGFTAGGRPARISVEGGDPIPLTGASYRLSLGSSWGEDGTVFHAPLMGGLLRIPSSDGAAVPVLDAPGAGSTFGWPQVLPGGKAVLFSVAGALVVPEKTTVEVLTLNDRRRKVIIQGGTSPRYLATSRRDGYLVYANRSTLFAVPFDLDRLETRSAAVPVLTDVGYNPESFEAHYDVSRTGTMVYRKPVPGSGSNALQWVDATGKRVPIASGPARNYSYLRLSPDGRRLAVTTVASGRVDLQVYDMQRETWTNLTSGLERDFFSEAWSPDGQFVVFGSFTGLFWARSDGASQPQQLMGNHEQHPSSIMPDGKQLAFFEPAGAGEQIWTVPLEVTNGQLKAGAEAPFLKSGFADWQPTFSPDGKWLAYASNSSGTFEIYVRAFPDNGRLWKISNSGGQRPIWSRRGHDLLYQEGDREMAVSYSSGGGTFLAEKPRVWLAKVGGEADDLSPDGQRLAVIAPVESATAPEAQHEVVLLLNFFDELRRRVPVNK
jgi:Tol biopolymer transport system component/tRNA A-37 threonylcarbamoyl transferase component Bud32